MSLNIWVGFHKSSQDLYVLYVLYILVTTKTFADKDGLEINAKSRHDLRGTAESDS